MILIYTQIFISCSTNIYSKSLCKMQSLENQTNCELSLNTNKQTFIYGYSYDEVQKIADGILNKTKYRPKLGIICGTGLGGLANILQDKDCIPYEHIQGFPISTVCGHVGQLVFGLLEGTEIICMQGRFHLYEGYPMWKCAMPVRVMSHLGVKTLFVTNAAGGLNSTYKVGDIMIIKDHINFPGFAGNHPLQGPEDMRFGSRFTPMSNAYDKDLILLAKKVAEELSLSYCLQEGIYVMLGGPSFETIAEAKMLQILGSDAVGMSTVHEVVIARQCDMRVFGMSLITNKVVTSYDEMRTASHEEVLEIGEKRAQDMQNLVTSMIKELKAIEDANNKQ